ncbi:MAG: hydrogenase maturation protease [Candidatus Omnitrophica bacterium]|nr:hydrogenase maturation protease [Candidatus Omnitrophota bacterium]
MLVVGIGNTLRMDDGIGVYLVRELKNYYDEKEVKIYEVGTETWRILPIIQEEKSENLLIVDAINFNFIPGFVYITKNPKIFDILTFSSHEKNYLDIEIMRCFDFLKNFYIFGIEPFKLDWKVGLSEILLEKYDEILNKLIKFCDSILKKEKENDLLGIERF